MDYFLILLLPPTFHSVVIATTDSNGVFLSILVDNRKGGRGGEEGRGRNTKYCAFLWSTQSLRCIPFIPADCA